MSPEEFRRYGHELIDWLADYHASLPDRPVMAKTKPGEIRDALPSAPPNEPEDFQAVINDLNRIVTPGLSLWQHPRFFGYFPANALPAGILADLVSTGLGVIGLSWQSSPAVTEVEEVVTDWLRQMLGLTPAWSGVIQDTASTSTLVALICARERATKYALARGGLQSEARKPRVYVSAHAHSSVDKGALARRLWPRQFAARSIRRQIRHAGRRARRNGRRGSRQRRPAGSDRRHGRHHGDDRDRSNRAQSPRSRGATESGCMSTRRWRAAR